MAATFGQLKTWKAAPLGAAGDGLKADLRKLESSRDDLQAGGVPKSWQGLAADAARVRCMSLVVKLGDHISDKQRMKNALYTAETEVEAIERMVQGILDRAKTQEFAVGDDGSVTSTATPPTFRHRIEAEEWGESRRLTAQSIADDITDALAKAERVDMILIDAIPAGTDQGLDDTREQRGMASPEVAERWAQLTDQEKRAIIDQKIEELAEEYGVEVEDIVWDETGNTNGSWHEGDHTVHLNPNRLEDPDVLHTVAHEMRHARQHEAVDDMNDWHFPWQDDPFDMHEEDGITEEQAEEWEDNFEDYQSTENGATFEEYYNQPVEADARRSGRDYLDTLTADELDRLLKESK
ncbi:hypothetical protein J2S40_002626 [Nocardioides luteus]|uniref:IrrE N-terminal-like domain-containing protein n=1 Tax=Nocardioides luteus TaxID=1844 RepID=A0ABQ5T3A2_9ACTN|nr:hypothetical protein [Nocardioides luteus]MDR7311568.1 hypothetical protein [Nocardioides luteus]GGR54709.1 hypothetical protein GCM10010197_21550 [Nocardioides luteus]GLJ70217.1 hypothetical protein GCM10017579_42530 [Nocardioides luteus]